MLCADTVGGVSHVIGDVSHVIGGVFHVIIKVVKKNGLLSSVMMTLLMYVCVFYFIYHICTYFYQNHPLNFNIFKICII